MSVFVVSTMALKRQFVEVHGFVDVVLNELLVDLSRIVAVA